MNSEINLAELDKLVGLFYSNTADLGHFNSLPADSIPEPQRSLLNHDMHMTVTVEKFHSSPVKVDVLSEKKDGQTYCREICLRRLSDDAIVQYGIVLLNFRHLDQEVQSEIQGQGKPLGRILIEHNVLRRVKPLSLYEVQPSEDLCSRLGSTPDRIYGRTAIIYCNDEPAIELLEIVV